MKNKLFVKSVWLLCLALGLAGCINDADVLPEDNSGFVDGGEGNVRFCFSLCPTILQLKLGMPKLRVFMKPEMRTNIM